MNSSTLPATKTRSRFAPSTTGPAHPGTLLAALLAWLDIRSRGGHLLLRLEDLDPERCQPQWHDHMLQDLQWLGLDWDEIQRQTERVEAYSDAMEHLAAQGRLYPCTCSRSEIKRLGVRAPDGGWRYPNTCRNAPLPAGGWRAATTPLRIRLEDEDVVVDDESGTPITQNPALEMGDPVALRRDGAFAYNLAAVVDDGLAGVNRIVRGRDLAPSTPTHWQVQALLGYPHPTYRHHLLFLEKNAQKLAKLHGSVGTPELRPHYSPKQLCGFLAYAVGLLSAPEEVSPAELLPAFDWSRVVKEDILIQWDGTQLSKEG